MQIRREVVEKFGPTLGCLKCRGLLARDLAYQYVHHREECRTRMEALMREDDGFRRHVESAELRLTKRLADVLERRDRESQDRKRSRQGADQRGGGDGDLEQGHQPEVAERTQSGGIPGDVVMGDDTGIPLATDDVMCSEARGSLRMWKGQEHLRPRDRSWSACSMWRRTRQSSTFARFSVDLACARWQKIWAYAGGTR